MRKAFTLIELLVVIAIIAILAAILFPVFAQAKVAAKKTKNLSNTKQLATATLIYTGDSDDTFPLAFSQRANGSWRSTTGHPIPSDTLRSDAFWSTADGLVAAGVFPQNSTMPYSKNAQIFDDSGYKMDDVFGEKSLATNPQNSHLTYNGLLMGWSATAVELSSKVPLWWQGNGAGGTTIRGYVNPWLSCSAVIAGSNCRFNPDQPAQSGASAGGYSWWGFPGTAYVFGNGYNESHTDSSAKFVKLAKPGSVNDVITDYYGQPFARIDPQGFPQSMWGCRTDSTKISYACYFRPDRDQ